MSIAVPLYGFGASGGSPNKSTIIVTAPTGSTVTCKMGSTTKTATEKNGVWTFGGLDLGTWTITSTKGGDIATQDVVITRLTVEYVTIVYRITPEFTYTGDYEVVDDSDNLISDFANWKNNWKIRFLTSGTLTFTKLNGWNGQLDVFLVGGGGAGGNGVWADGYVQSDRRGGGAGAGYTTTKAGVSVTINTPYSINIGAGAAAPWRDPKDEGSAGGDTSAFSFTAKGGGASKGGSGGNGGSGGGNEGHEGATDGGGGTNAGAGQGTTTREFGESSGKLYATGGSGVSKKNGQANTGDGGSGGKYNETSSGTAASGGSGGSGIAIIRNHRGEAA